MSRRPRIKPVKDRSPVAVALVGLLALALLAALDRKSVV